MCSSGVVKQNKLYFTFISIFLHYVHLGFCMTHLTHLPVVIRASSIWSIQNDGVSQGLTDPTELEREREMFYLTTHSTHFIYGYMASDIWLRTILIVRKETRCRHIGYSYRLTARVLLYAPSHRQDSTYHGLCYTSRGALAGTRNSSMGPTHEGSIRRPIAPWANALPLPTELCTRVCTAGPHCIQVFLLSVSINIFKYKIDTTSDFKCILCCLHVVTLDPH